MNNSSLPQIIQLINSPFATRLIIWPTSPKRWKEQSSICFIFTSSLLWLIYFYVVRLNCLLGDASAINSIWAAFGKVLMSFQCQVLIFPFITECVWTDNIILFGCIIYFLSPFFNTWNPTLASKPVHVFHLQKWHQKIISIQVYKNIPGIPHSFWFQLAFRILVNVDCGKMNASILIISCKDFYTIYGSN